MDDPTGVVALLDTQAWPGGLVRIQSEDFRRFGSEVTVTLNGASLTASQVEATVLAVRLPTNNVAGSFSLTASYAGRDVAVGPLELAGFASSRDLPASAHILWDAYAIQAAAQPLVIGGTNDGALAIVNLLTGFVVSTPDVLDWQRLRGPGVSHLPGTWILRDGDPLTAWEIGTTATLAADQPDFLPGVTRQVAHLAPNRWLTTTNQGWTLHGRADAISPWTVSATGTANEPEGVHLSPRGDRATLRVDRIATGVPVFDVAQGDVAFTTTFTSVQGVSFSATGTRLVLVGGKGTGVPGEGTTPSEIELIDATTGAVLATRTLELPAFSVAHHPSGDWILVGVGEGAEGATRPAILVLRATDLAPVATLRSPASAPTCSEVGTCLGGVITALGNDVHAFVSWNGPPHSWRFRLLEP
jgi:hypothetical protein